MFLPRWSYSILSLAVFGCADDPAGSTPERFAAGLEIVSGQDQNAQVGEQLAAPTVVRVVDPNGEPVEGETVNFQVSEGGGHFLAGSDVSDANGLASDVWVLGTDASAAHRALALLPGSAGVIDSDTFQATARPGPPHEVRVIGDTIASIVRGDSIDVAFTILDEWDNVIDDDSVDVTWATSAAGVAEVADARIVGIREGDAVITVLAGAASARIHVHVEGTRAYREAVLGGTLVAGADLLLRYSGSSIQSWDGSAWAPLAMSFVPAMSDARSIFISPMSLIWAIAPLYCDDNCPVHGIFEREEATLSTLRGQFQVHFTTPGALGFTADGSVLFAANVFDHQNETFEPSVWELRDGEGYFEPLAFPATISADTVIERVSDLAVTASGDVYVTGSARHVDAAPGSGASFVARWDGEDWSFLDIPRPVWTSHLEASGDAVYVPHGTVAAGDWQILRIDGDVVQVVPTIMDGEPVHLGGFTVSATGDLALSYYDAQRAGAAYQVAGAWQQWEESRPNPRTYAPVWFEGEIWFRMDYGVPVQGDRYLLRLEPEPS